MDIDIGRILLIALLVIAFEYFISKWKNRGRKKCEFCKTNFVTCMLFIQSSTVDKMRGGGSSATRVYSACSRKVCTDKALVEAGVDTVIWTRWMR